MRGTEIERKFLVDGDGWRGDDPGELYRQGYLSTGPGWTVRVRVTERAGYLTLKGPATGPACEELEYEIPVEEARAILEGPVEGAVVEKRRHRIAAGAVVFEVDEFLGENAGLVVAEVELTSEDEEFDRPSWLGREVTDDPRYRNASLARSPFRAWQGEG